MANRLFVLAVVALWLASMSWLINDRILPSIYEGEPPVEESYENGKAVAWQVEWEGQVVGEAASVRLLGVSGSTELHNRVQLNDIPLMELAPTWMRTTVGSFGDITFDAKTRIEFDAIGNFSAFNSRISINDLPSVLRMSGRIEDSHLNLRVSSGEMSYTTSIYLPDTRSMNEILFPTASLSGMYVGRTWREEVYSPFHSPGDPIEMLLAEVVAKEQIMMGEEVKRAYRIEYRTLNVSGITHDAHLQAECWVEPSTGRVLRRDVFLGDSKLRFNRVDDEGTEAVGRELLDELVRTGAEIEF